MKNQKVVLLEAHRHGDDREVEEHARQHLKQSVFVQEPHKQPDINTMRVGDVFPLESSTNRALILAQQHDFLGMCLPILWGDEKRVHFERFGWLLRGAVTTFKPLTVFELYLVKNIVAAQWRLDRLAQTQANIYEHESKGGAVGRYGLPQASHSAMELDAQMYAAQEALSIAIKNHLMTMNSIIKTHKRGAHP